MSRTRSSHGRPGKKKKATADEIIESDVEEQNFEEGAAEEEGSSNYSESLTENVEERKVRLAKAYLERLKHSRVHSRESDVSVSLEEEQEDNLVQTRKKAKFECKLLARNLRSESPLFFKGHKDCVTAVAIDPENRSRVFTASKDCNIIIWDISEGRKISCKGRKYKIESFKEGHIQHITDICVLRRFGGNALLSVGRDRTVRIWDIRTPKCVSCIIGHNKPITGVAAGGEPTPEHFYTVSDDKTLKMWDITTQRAMETFFGHTGPICSMDLMLRDKVLTGGCDGTVRFWKTLNDTHLIFQKELVPIDAVSQLNERQFLSGDQGGKISLWSCSSRKPLYLQESPHGGSWVTALACVRNSDLCFSGSCDGSIRAWNISSSARSPDIEQVSGVSIPVSGFVNQIKLSEDGALLVAGVGKEPRLGRWCKASAASNGLLVANLSYDGIGA